MFNLLVLKNLVRRGGKNLVMAKHDLVDQLEKRQATLGLSDNGFSARLGLSRPQWMYLKGGGTPGRKTLEAVMAVFPDLAPQVLSFLLATKDEKQDTKVSDTSETATEAVR